MIIILCGKSGSGKDYISKRLGYKPIISYTTRPMRENETNGVEYWFCSNKEFIDMINNDEMIEYRTYNTLYNGKADVWYYGLRKEKIKETECNYVVILDLNGAKSFIDYYGKDICKVFYIDASDKERTNRAKSRGSFDETEWNRRLIADERDFDMGEIDRIGGIRIKNENREIDEVIKEIVTKVK